MLMHLSIKKQLNINSLCFSFVRAITHISYQWGLMVYFVFQCLANYLKRENKISPLFEDRIIKLATL